MADLPELDLSAPGKLFSKAEHEQNTTFHMVLPTDKYTKASLAANPAVNPADQLMRPWVVDHGDLGGDGKAVLDLKATGRANDIQKAIEEITKGGNPCPPVVRGLVIVTAQAPNKVPAKQLADVKDFKLLPMADLQLKGIVDYVTVQQFKKGTKSFVAELVIEGPMGKVKLSAHPSAEITVEGVGKGTGNLVIDVEPGKKYKVTVPVPFTKKNEKRTKKVPPSYKNWVPGGWRTGGAKAVYDRRIGAWVVVDSDIGKVRGDQLWQKRTDTKEVWKGGNIVLTAQGVGRFDDVKKAVKFRAESWASGWLLGPPPPPFRHNVC